jgi:hypothetical protein
MLILSLTLAFTSPQAPPLGFIGLRAGMPVSEARALITGARGSLSCKKTSDARLRECTGMMPFPKLRRPFEVLVSSIRDSAAVIVLTTAMSDTDTREWVRTLAQELGPPTHKRGARESWQWVRRGQMLRVVLHRAGKQMEAAITLTHGPLLDGLGPANGKTPD